MTSPQAALETLARTAVLGTGRDAAAPAFEGPLRPFAVGETPESAVLRAASAATLAGRAGRVPAQSETAAIPPCPPETQPYFSERAASLLDVCLSAQRQLLPQALRWAAQSGRIAPPRLLPSLLETGRGSRDLRPSLALILGERGRWLAQLNPDWKQVAAPVDAELETSWKEGEIAARREALRLQRELDPAAARAWVELTFKTEGAKERAEWLDALIVNLSQDDEAFLESALDDKSKDVRATAVNLLQRLPQSRLVARAATALEPLLKWTVVSKFLGLKTTRTLEVELPAAWDPKWLRDGLEEKPPGYARAQNLGEKAAWIKAWLDRVPPSHWERVWNASPGEIIAAAPADWRNLLLSGWWDAALRFGDKAWPQALLAATDPAFIRGFFRFSHLTAEQADAFALTLWDKNGAELNSNSALGALLLSHPGPWSVELSRRFLQAAREEMRREIKNRDPNANRFNWVRNVLPGLGERFPVEMAAEATTGWPEDPNDSESTDRWAPSIARFLNTLQLRADLRREFQP